MIRCEASHQFSYSAWGFVLITSSLRHILCLPLSTYPCAPKGELSSVQVFYRNHSPFSLFLFFNSLLFPSSPLIFMFCQGCVIRLNAAKAFLLPLSSTCDVCISVLLKAAWTLRANTQPYGSSKDFTVLFFYIFCLTIAHFLY